MALQKLCAVEAVTEVIEQFWREGILDANRGVWRIEVIETGGWGKTIRGCLRVVIGVEPDEGTHLIVDVIIPADQS